MRFWHLITARLRAIVLRQRSENEMDEELRLHLERTIEQRIAAGMPPEEARRLSRLEFGGVEQIKEDCRDARGIGLFDNLARDTRHGVRRLVRDWQFTTAAVLILALGIGANTAIFSVVNTALFRRAGLRSRSTGGDLPAVRRLRISGRQHVPRLSRHGGVHRRLRGDDRCVHQRGPVPGQRGSADGHGRVHDALVSLGARACAPRAAAGSILVRTPGARRSSPSSGTRRGRHASHRIRRSSAGPSASTPRR